MEKTIENELLPYRIVIRNVTANDDSVRENIRKEFGESVEVLDWHIERVINYKGSVSPGLELPQRETIIKLNYRKKNK